MFGGGVSEYSEGEGCGRLRGSSPYLKGTFEKEKGDRFGLPSSCDLLLAVPALVPEAVLVLIFWTAVDVELVGALLHHECDEPNSATPPTKSTAKPARVPNKKEKIASI